MKLTGALGSPMAENLKQIKMEKSVKDLWKFLFYSCVFVTLWHLALFIPPLTWA